VGGKECFEIPIPHLRKGNLAISGHAGFRVDVDVRSGILLISNPTSGELGTGQKEGVNKERKYTMRASRKGLIKRPIGFLCLMIFFLSTLGCSGLWKSIKKSVGKRYRVSILECLVQPTKANNNRWDVGFGSFTQAATVLMDLQVLGVGRITDSLVSDIKAKGESGPAAPDLCVVVRTI
jgi:hypothetical protein